MTITIPILSIFITILIFICGIIMAVISKLFTKSVFEKLDKVDNKIDIMTTELFSFEKEAIEKFANRLQNDDSHEKLRTEVRDTEAKINEFKGMLYASTQKNI